MKNFKIGVFVLILAFAGLFGVPEGYGQSILGFETNGLHLDFLIKATAFHFDGKESSIIGDAGPAPGLKYKIKFKGFDFDPGVYINIELDVKNGSEPNYKFGPIFGIKIYKFFVGPGWNIYQEGEGLVGFKKRTGFFAINLKI